MWYTKWLIITCCSFWFSFVNSIRHSLPCFFFLCSNTSDLWKIIDCNGSLCQCRFIYKHFRTIITCGDTTEGAPRSHSENFRLVRLRAVLEWGPIFFFFFFLMHSPILSTGLHPKYRMDPILRICAHFICEFTAV
jgi:hypothetical protein